MTEHPILCPCNPCVRGKLEECERCGTETHFRLCVKCALANMDEALALDAAVQGIAEFFGYVRMREELAPATTRKKGVDTGKPCARVASNINVQVALKERIDSMSKEATKTVTIVATRTIAGEKCTIKRDFEIPKTLEGYLTVFGEDSCIELLEYAHKLKLNAKLAAELIAKVTGKVAARVVE